jgi:DNA-binding transcriptional LysR family regulator
MMQELDAAVADAVAATGGAASPCASMRPRQAATWLIAPRLGRFRRALPGVALDLVVAMGDQLRAALVARSETHPLAEKGDFL